MEVISRVHRSKKEAKESYDRLSHYYDLLTSPFERKYQDMALKRLRPIKGESILEIGFGTGYCLEQIAEKVGETGKAYGIDISSGMLEKTKERLETAGLAKRVKLNLGDAEKLPYGTNKFNAVFMSFTLELFDTPAIPDVLGEIRRVLKKNGRVCVLGLSKENEDSRVLEMYEWFHGMFPKFVDCRPIYIEQYVRNAEFRIRRKDKAKLFGMPLEIVVGVKTE